jgi:hypothetical protein
MNQVSTLLFSRNSIAIAFTASIIYLLLSQFLIGFKTDQLVLIAIFNTCYFASIASRKFITGFSIFIIYWIIFDSMKAFPNYSFTSVHIRDLYDIDKSIFGFNYLGKSITPNEYWLLNGNALLDVLAGVFYLCWIPVPLAFAAYLFFKDKDLFLHFSFTFVLVNILGFIIYYIYPAAPPWYYQLNGANFIPTTLGNTAGLHKFDAYFNLRLFGNLYEKGSNVFAAMPSLHSSYPVIVLYFGLKNKSGWMNLVFAFVAIGIWSAAIYTSHHYVVDVLAGIICAITGIAIFEKTLLRNKAFNRFLQYYKVNI